MARRHKPRRGVVLLIVLMLLTLLMVIGLTFAVISGQFRRGAEASCTNGPVRHAAGETARPVHVPAGAGHERSVFGRSITQPAPRLVRYLSAGPDWIASMPVLLALVRL